VRHFSKAHLSDPALLQHAGGLLGEERGTLAQFLACQRAQALLGVPASELPKLFGRAVRLLVRELEKRKFAATDRPRSSKAKPSRNPRYIPAHVKRAVWERDQARCTFVSETGHRCPAESRLEFDHVEPLARGGQATAANLRLRCRAHNQYAAERAFGAGLMHQKREAARAAKARHAAEEVIPWLRTLGFRAEESKRAAARCETMPEAPLEERIRVSLQGFGRRPQPCASSASHRPT
jgi:5-methylcytosine-specific restriction endonuclease McrA